MNRRRIGSGKLCWEKIGGGKRMYYADYRDASGKRCRPRLGTDKRYAQREFYRLINERDRALSGLPDESLQDRRVLEIHERYVAHLASNRAPSYLKGLEPRLERILDAVGDVRVRQLDSEVLLRWQEERKNAGPLSKRRPGRPTTLANRTVNMDINALKQMLNWAVKARLIAVNPIRELPMLSQGEKDRVHLRRALTWTEIDLVLNAAEAIDERKADRKAARKSIDGGTRGAQFAEKERLPYVPQAPLWRALIFTGARWGELTRTVWDDVSLLRRTIRLRAKVTKNSRERTIPIVDEQIIADLKILRRIQTDLLGREPRSNEPIFLSPRGRPQWNAASNARTRLIEVIEKSGVKREDEMGRVIDIHALRYTCASMLAMARVQLVVAQKMLGHSDPKLTAALYTDLGVDELRVAVELVEAYRQDVAGKREQTGELDLGSQWAVGDDEDLIREALARYATRRSA